MNESVISSWSISFPSSLSFETMITAIAAMKMIIMTIVNTNTGSDPSDSAWSETSSSQMPTQVSSPVALLSGLSPPLSNTHEPSSVSALAL